MRTSAPMLALPIVMALSGQVRAAQSVVVTGSWSLQVDASDLAGGAGTDIDPAIESAASQITINISGTTDSSDAWRVEVSLGAGALPDGAGVAIRRTSPGSGPGAVSGGTGFIALSTTPVELLSGTGDRAGILAQLQLDGLSVSTGVDAWASSVVYTIVDQ